MQILLNGKPITILESISVTNLLTMNNLNSESVVIEINAQIIQKEFYPTVLIQDGDRVEVLHIVGGG